RVAFQAIGTPIDQRCNENPQRGHLMSPLRSVCVFCGSRSGHNPAYTQAAQAFGKGLAANNWRLVYGAGDVGLMGEVARSAQNAGATTMGVIPTHLMGREQGK